MELCGVIYVVGRKLREQAREKYVGEKGRNSRNIESLSTCFALANSRIVITGDVPKEKAGTESKRYGKLEVPYPLFVKTTLSSRFEKEAACAFLFEKCPVFAEKDLSFFVK